MDAVQFGRWFSKRRQACGWQSQRTLVDAVRRDPFLKASGISEDFLARLEAGHLAHPFRSSVRRRVLALAWLLCKTPRDLQTYLRAAELNDLGAEEADQVQRLGEHLAVQQSPSPLLLPLRPTRLIGRSTELHELLNALCKKDVNVFAVTGMPGGGKSALAYETLHMLACDEHERVRLFPHGIATFTGRGRRGINGLISLLSGITTVFHSLAASDSNPRSLALVPTLPQFTDVDLACAIDRVRAALAGKRVLILLDDLEADFPLRQALETLLVRSQIDMAGHELRKNGDSSQERHVVLITSSYIPAPALVTSRLHLSPLRPEAALDLLANLVGRGMVEMERQHAERICAAVATCPWRSRRLLLQFLQRLFPSHCLPRVPLNARSIDCSMRNTRFVPGWRAHWPPWDRGCRSNSLCSQRWARNPLALRPLRLYMYKLLLHWPLRNMAYPLSKWQACQSTPWLCWMTKPRKM